MRGIECARFGTSIERVIDMSAKYDWPRDDRPLHSAVELLLTEPLKYGPCTDPQKPEPIEETPEHLIGSRD
jgi:hypothetical protein